MSIDSPPGHESSDSDGGSDEPVDSKRIADLEDRLDHQQREHAKALQRVAALEEQLDAMQRARLREAAAVVGTCDPDELAGRDELVDVLGSILLRVGDKKTVGRLSGKLHANVNGRK